MASNLDLVRAYMRAVNDDAMDITRSLVHPKSSTPRRATSPEQHTPWESTSS